MDRDRVLAYRAAGHNLVQRVHGDQMAAAVGAIGVRDVKGGAVLALHARVNGFTSDQLQRSVGDHTIVRVASARGARLLVPADDVDIFTIGTLPADEQSLRARLKPFLPVLDRSGFTAAEALDLAVTVARDTLAAGPASIEVLSGALTRALPALSPMCRGRCGTEHIEQGLFDLVGESGVWRAEERDGAVTYVGLEERASRRNPRAELVRRYLRCHGPSTPAHFAPWCGISAQDAARSLADAGTTDLGNGTYLLTEDLGRLESPTRDGGVRLLPPADPYLLDRDRATLVPDAAARKRIWRATPTDGIVLVDGEPTASWRANKARAMLHLEVALFASRSAVPGDELEREATAVAALRGCAAAEVLVR